MIRNNVKNTQNLETVRKQNYSIVFHSCLKGFFPGNHFHMLPWKLWIEQWERVTVWCPPWFVCLFRNYIFFLQENGEWLSIRFCKLWSNSWGFCRFNVIQLIPLVSQLNQAGSRQFLSSFPFTGFCFVLIFCFICLNAWLMLNIFVFILCVGFTVLISVCLSLGSHLFSIVPTFF